MPVRLVVVLRLSLKKALVERALRDQVHLSTSGRARAHCGSQSRIHVEYAVGDCDGDW